MALPLLSAPKSLCLLRLSALGDVCHIIPIVRTLQARWPETRLTWVIGRLEAELVGDIPGVEFIIFDKAKGLAAYHKLRKAMTGRNFDILLHMQTSLRATAASTLIRADIRLGFDRTRARDGQWVFTNHKIAPGSRQHVLDSFFSFLKALGIEEQRLLWNIPIPPEAEAFSEEHFSGDHSTLVISPCSSARFRNFRNWDAARYAVIADHAAEKYGLRLVLSGGRSAIEKEYGKNISSLIKNRALNLIGKTGLKELLAVLKKATVLISPDSGPAHIATAVGTPVIGLYATSNPARTGPYLSQKWVVNKYPESVREEFKKSVNEIPWGRRVRNPKAMESITTADVIYKLDELMRHLGFVPK